MDLNGNDKLFVDSSSSDKTHIHFVRGNGASLKLLVYKSGIVDFEYTSESGKVYETSKPAGDFTIANLVYND